MTEIQALKNDSDRLQSDLSDLGHITMDKYNHIHANLESINTNNVSTNLYENDNATKRICIANDDIPISNLQKYIVDKRIDSYYRFKTCSGVVEVSYETYDIVGSGFSVYPSYVSHPFGTLSVYSENASDIISNSGCRTVSLTYIDSSGNTQIASVNMNGTTPVSIGSNVRELIEFKCNTVGPSGSNLGRIFLTNSDSTYVSLIGTSENNSTFFGIEIPQNGKTLLKSLTISNLETETANVDLEVQLLVIERYTSSPNYIYRIIFAQMCQFQKSITFDLSCFPAISGSGSSSSNFAIYPIAKGISTIHSSYSIGVFLSALNVD